MRKSLFAAAVLAVLMSTATMFAQSAGTDTWATPTNPKGWVCNIHPPENAPARQWFCFASVIDSEQTGDVSTLTLYVTVQPDNTFSNGLISKSPSSGTADSFSSSNYSGTFTPDPSSVANGTFTGTFSGATTNGVSFTGQNTEVIGLGQVCAGRYGCRPANGRVVSATGSVTFQ